MLCVSECCFAWKAAETESRSAMTFPRAYWACAVLAAIALGALNADQDGFSVRAGSPIDIGSAAANGLLAFAIAAVCAALGYGLMRR